MSYDIGQIRSSSISNFYNTIVDQTQNENQKRIEYRYTVVDDELNENNKTEFMDPCLQQNLEQGKYYYLKFTVAKQNTLQNFTLKLKNEANDIEDEEEQTQNIKTYSILPPQGNLVTFETILTPNKNYSQIVWELKRTVQNDYNEDVFIYEDTTDYSLHNIIGRRLIISDVIIYEITNILTTNPDFFGNVNKIVKIGVQGPSGLLMCINGEQLRIGKSRIFEINEEISINFIGFIPEIINSQVNDYFIMDYEYSTSN